MRIETYTAVASNSEPRRYNTKIADFSQTLATTNSATEYTCNNTSLLYLLQNTKEYTGYIEEMYKYERLSNKEMLFLRIEDLEHLARYIDQLKKEKKESTIGFISRFFESGSDSVGAIGYDPRGGTSYGMYQFSSSFGTVEKFLAFLEKEDPSIRKYFMDITPTNTGSKEGKFPEVWKSVSREKTERFAFLQHAYAMEYYYKPVESALHTAIPRNRPVKEMLFSTAIQHGVQGAIRILTQAYAQKPRTTTELIKTVYALRKQDFPSATPAVHKAVMQRLNTEMHYILQL